MLKNFQRLLSERGRLARQRVCALKDVAPEINIEFMRNAF
jgi:hypothetical protein